MSNQLPKYVTHGGDFAYPPPIYLENASLSGFFVKADPDKLSALVDKVFAEPSNGAVKYVPLFNYVYMTLGNMPKVYPGDRGLGFTTEKELTVWVMVAARKTGSQRVVDHFALFPAVVVIDDPYSLVTGREVLGWFKGWGRVTGVTDQSAHPPKFNVETFGHKVRGDQAAYQQLLSFTHVDHEKGDWPVLDGLEDIAKYLFQVIKDHPNFLHPRLLVAWEACYDAFRDFMKGEVPMVVLKQIRASQGDRAVYQAILRSLSTVEKFHSIDFLGFYQLDCSDVYTLSLKEIFGIESSEDYHIGTRIVLDFTVGGGEEIWKAGG